jgi:hypothetical protein
MKRDSLILGAIFLFLVSAQTATAATTDFESAFTDATNMSGRTGSGAVKDTDYLVKGTTSVLHAENMAILAEIDKLHKEIAELKKEIEDVKDIVEGGN